MTLWWLYAVVGSLFLAMYVNYNQIARLSSLLLMMYRGFGVTLVMIPLAIILLPQAGFGWQFYALCSLQGLLIGFIDNRFFRSAKAFGGEITGAFQPLSIALTFAFWFFVKPENFTEAIQNPIKFLIIIACLCGVIISVMLLKKAKINKKAFLYLLPCILIVGFNDTNVKVIMNLGDNNKFVAIYFYTMVSALFSGIFCVFTYIKKNQKFKTLFIRKNIRHGILIILILIGLVAFKAYAVALAPNPAYVVAITYLSPIWIVLMNGAIAKLTNIKLNNRIDIKVLILLLLSIITLILINS